MDPDTFLSQSEVPLLVQALNTLAIEVDAASSRKAMLVNAGVDLAFCSKLIFETSSSLFANKLVAYFREYRVSVEQPLYHPLVNLLEYLLQTHELEDQDRSLFNRLVKQGQENFGGLIARCSVGRIEAPLGITFGTGVLVGRQLLLTCNHVFERVLTGGEDRAWVRFGYKTGKYGIEQGKVFELDIKNIVCHDSQSDYALVKVLGEPAGYYVAPLFTSIPTAMQNVRLIHHPRGEPMQISEVGQIIQMDKEYMNHTIKVDYGSSGGPIFDLRWRVVAIQRGTLLLSRPLPSGITEGLPLYSIWDDLKPHLSS